MLPETPAVEDVNSINSTAEIQYRTHADERAERSLLATIMSPGAEGLALSVVEQIDPEFFFYKQHRVIYEAGLRVLEANIELSLS